MPAKLPWADVEIDKNDSLFDPGTHNIGGEASAAGLERVCGLLISPDTGLPLHASGAGFTTTAGETFQIDRGRPVLLPRAARNFSQDTAETRSPSGISNAFEQYLYLATIKNAMGEANTSADDPWYRRHLFRSRQLVQSAKGLVLDIGCDNPDLSRRLFPATAEYLGLEPSRGNSDIFRIIGMAEFLPFASASVDCIAFLTSLDHILDYHTAVDEALRVLRPGGKFYLASLVWTAKAELYHDTIHFHHFRDYELRGAMRSLNISSLKRYAWKGDRYRTGFYIEATKPF